MRPSATIQLTAIELVTGKPKGLAISTALCERPCSSGSGLAEGRPNAVTPDGVFETISDFALAPNVGAEPGPGNTAIITSKTTAPMPSENPLILILPIT